MNNLFWYAPAETKIPIKAILQCVNRSTTDAEYIIRQATASTYCLIGPSGRALLYCLLKSLKEKHGHHKDEILIPGYTCYSVAAAAVKAGLKIRLYDLDPKTLNPDIGSIKSNCSKQTLAVISQHLFGIPTDVSLAAQIAKQVGAYHIEDAAQALGGISQKKHLGTQGDFGLYSFGRGKPLPLGGGGALVSQHYQLEELIEPFESKIGWHSYAVSTATQVIAHPSIYGLAEILPLGLGETIFDPCFRIGKVSNKLLGLLADTMDALPKLNTHRNRIASIYREKIRPDNLISIQERSVPVHSRFPVLAKKDKLPMDLYQKGFRRLYPHSLNKEPQIAAYVINPDQKLNGSETLAKELVTLPTHHSISEKRAESIAIILNRWISA